MKRIAFIIFCLGISPLLHAETVYIGDNLRVGVRTEPGNQTSPIAVITSGEALELLERANSYSKIRTEKGTEGWVRNTYISDTPPAKLRVAELETQFQATQQKANELQNQNQELAQKNKSLSDEINALQQQIAYLSPGSQRTWIFLIIAIIALCGFTFTLGILWHKQQVTKKLGGQSL